MIRLDRESGRHIRWYAHPGAVDRTVKQAADVARIGKRVTSFMLLDLETQEIVNCLQTR